MYVALLHISINCSAIQSPTEPRQQTFLVPYQRNPHFTGRYDLLAHLRAKMVEAKPNKYNHRVAIYGMGGVGKTQVAIEYVYRYRDDYDGIYWITASDQTILLSGFQKIGSTAGCVRNPGDLNPTEVAKQVRGWLGGQGKWLLIIDNLDEISVADDYLPDTNNGGHTLITTRNPNARDIPAEGFEIPLLSESESIDLLCRGSKPENRADYTDAERLYAVPIIQELGCLALAIIQASAFIRTCCRGDMSKYLSLYKTSRKALLREPSDSQYMDRRSVVDSFLLSFGKVTSQAATLLRLFAFLNPDGILPDFLKAGCHGLSEELREIINDEYVYLTSLRSLEAYSLVSRSNSEGSMIVHRLIQAVLKDNMSNEELDRYRHEVVNLCQESFPDFENDGRERCRRFQNQVVEPALEAAKVCSRNAAVLLNHIGVFLRVDGKYMDSMRMMERSAEILKFLFGDQHPDTLSAMNNLALMYKDQGKLAEAAELEEKILEMRRKIFGDEHSDTLSSMNNLATIYQDQGRLIEAAELEEKVLEVMRKVLGDEHPNTLMSMNNLALTYWHLRKLADAARLVEKALKMRRIILGNEHPDTLSSMNNLAMMYQDHEKLTEAAELEANVLEGRRRVLGDEHPDTLQSMRNLASIFRDQGKLVEAAELEELWARTSRLT
jgi:tetratricopeptide (TPR) repeat protein